VPLSSLNRARRALVDALDAAAVRRHETTGVGAAALLAAARPPDQPPPPAGLFVLCRNLAQAHAALDAGADGIYLDFLELTGTGDAVRALRARGPVQLGLTPPRIRKPGEDKIDRYLASLAPDLLLVRSLGALASGAGSGVPRIGDFALNVTNHLTAHEVLARDLCAFTPAFDLDAAQLVALLDADWAPYAEVVAHHPMPLFHMEHCVIAALLSDGHDHKSCGRPCERHPEPLHQPRRERPRRRDAHLLAEDRPHRELEAVDVSRHAAPRRLRDQRRQQRVGRQHLVDREQVGVLVAQAARERRVVGGRQHGAVAQRAPVHAVGDLLDAGHRAGGEEVQVEPRRRVGLAALAGAVALAPRRGRRRQERTVAWQWAARTRGPAVDARGAHGDDERAVIAAVALVADAMKIEHAGRTRGRHQA